MAKVPYQPFPTVEPSGQGAPSVSLATPGAAFGTNVAQALQGLGQTTEQAGNELWGRAVALQTLNNETEAREADAQYMIQSGELHAKFNSLEGKARQDALEGHIQALQDLRTGLRSGLSNDMARRMYDSSSLSTMGRNIFNAAGAAASANKQWNDQVDASNIYLAGKTVSDNPDDEALVKERTNSVTQIIRQQYVRNGLDPDSPPAKAEILKQTSKIALARLEGMSVKEPNKALALMPKLEGQMTDDDKRRAEVYIRGQVRAVSTVNIANEVYEAGKETDVRPGKPLAEMQAEAKAKAEKLYPDDPITAQHAVAALDARYRIDTAARRQENYTNLQAVYEAIPTVTSMQDLLADPKLAAAFHSLPPKTQLTIPGAIAKHNQELEKADTDFNFKRLWGMSNDDVGKFLDVDLPREHITHAQYSQLLSRRAQLIKDTTGDPRVQHAKGVMLSNFGTQLNDLGITHRTTTNADDYYHYLGSLQVALDHWQQNTGKLPTDKDIREQIGPQIIRSVATPGRFWGTNQTPFFKQDVPDKFATDLKNALAEQGQPEPDPSEIYKAYIRAQLIQLEKKKDGTGGK